MEKEEWKGLMAARLDKEAREAQQRAAAALEKQRDDEIEVRGGGGGGIPAEARPRIISINMESA